jgi:hypothetical protein
MNKPKTRTLKTVIPPEFNREKYAGLIGQSAYVWHSVLSKRSDLNNRVDNEFRTSGVSDKVKSDVLAMLANPMPSERDIAEGKKFGSHEDYNREADGIQYLVMYDMLRVSDDRHRYGPAIAAYRGNGKGSDPALIHKPVYLVGKNAALTPVMVEVKVNMTAPDDILIDDFRQWLRITRESIAKEQSKPAKRRRSSPMTQSELDKQVLLGVIQYIDLALWAKAFSVRLTAPQYAKAIFGNLLQVRRISRFKSKDAAELLDKDYLDRLDGQGRSEGYRPESKRVGG